MNRDSDATTTDGQRLAERIAQGCASVEVWCYKANRDDERLVDARIEIWIDGVIVTDGGVTLAEHPDELSRSWTLYGDRHTALDPEIVGWLAALGDETAERTILDLITSGISAGMCLEALISVAGDEGRTAAIEPVHPRSIEALAVELVEALDGDPNDCDVRHTPIWRDLVGAVRRDRLERVAARHYPRSARRDLPAEGSQAAAALETPADERPLELELSDVGIVLLARVIAAARHAADRCPAEPDPRLRTLRIELIAATSTLDAVVEHAARLTGHRS